MSKRLSLKRSSACRSEESKYIQENVIQKSWDAPNQNRSKESISSLNMKTQIFLKIMVKNIINLPLKKVAEIPLFPRIMSLLLIIKNK